MSTNCKLWDIAAGWVLVTVAGGIVTTPEGEPLFPLDLAAYAGEELPTLVAGAALHRRSARSC
ncbi:MAG TPA: inositol monophosphatase family protein [Phycisphaerae bacterium]|nr:inositol monophosphatase family protein [Phycisphaerae bacterium]